MNWPNKIYVATRNLGVFYTENFRTPEIQPIWYPINEGLPSLDVVEFHVDLRPPEQRNNKDIIYALLSNHSTIYSKIGTDPWRLYMSAYGIHGFDAAPGGGIVMTMGARGVVDPVMPYYTGPGDGGNTGQKLCDCDVNCCCSYCDEGRPTIWTYGCGSPRKNLYCFAYGMGAIGYISKKDDAACSGEECVYEHAIHYQGCLCHDGDDTRECCYCQTHHVGRWMCTGTGNWCAPLITTPYTSVMYVVIHPNLSGFYLATTPDLVQCAPLNGIGSDSSYDSLWVDPDDQLHMRLVSGGVINETFNGQWQSGYTSGSVGGISSIADWAGEDPDNIIAGRGSGENILGCLEGMEDDHFKSIAGAMRNIPPFTGAIPSSATGGIALSGIYPVPREPGGIRIYAVDMPYYKGDQRGRPSDGDRAGWDVVNYPDVHAKDLKDGRPTRHAPLPTGEGDIIYSTSGSTWDTYRLPSLAGFGHKETIFTFGGELHSVVGPYRFYNKLGVNQLVTKVVLSVAGAPQGQEVVVDIRRLFSSFDVQGSSVWSPNNGSPGWEDVRPRISSGSYYGETSDDLSPRGASSGFVWGNGRALRAEVVQAGSAYGGAYLTVHLVHEDTAEVEPGFVAVTHQHAMINCPGTTQHAMIVGPSYTIQHAYMEGVQAYWIRSQGCHAYIRGRATASGSQHAYIQGV